MEHEYIRPLTTIDEFRQLVALQKEVWGLPDMDVVPVHIFKAVAGLLGPTGIILGYFLDDRMRGYLMVLPTADPVEVLGSMVGVSREVQRRGVGYKLNLALREMLLAHGVERMCWTFDPLESVNAYLYLTKLGGIVTGHYPDYYGTVDSQMHSGLPTDRFKVVWNIRSKAVVDRIDRGIVPDLPRVLESLQDVRQVDIPLDVQDLRQADMRKALEWRTKTRALFEEYVEIRKLLGVHFVYDRDEGKGTYIFGRPVNS